MAVLIAGCNGFIQIAPRYAPVSAGSEIVYVTVTPTPAEILGQLDAPPIATLVAPPLVDNANELGKLMILEYHRIGLPEGRFQRSPENFRADLQRLYEGGYYPVNFIDVLQGLPDLPAGKKPVVLSFDDSHPSQFRILEDKTIDGDSAVGILLNFSNQHPDDWPPRATFFVLGNDSAEHAAIFGQAEWAKPKLQFLAHSGMEIGSHTVNHVDLSVATAERIYWELAVSKHVIEEMVPGYSVKTLSVPYGGFPFDPAFLMAGEWGEYSYSYLGNVAAWGGPTVSPFDEAFDPFKVPRIEVTSESMDRWLAHFEKKPEEYYVSDGDPGQVAAPEVDVVAEQ
ncbi:MAG: polysaccharide deacetylase family protein [Anaerolineae bacterium]|nr:polysaccharide deacetylase family protein [Anaerolineae bacterium]